MTIILVNYFTIRKKYNFLVRSEISANESAKATLSGFSKSLQLVILLFESKEIYAYIGGDMRTGKKYTYQEITDLVKRRRSDKNFSVVIKASKNTTYKNTVDLLYLITTEQIHHYALIDITKEEEDYMHQIYP